MDGFRSVADVSGLDPSRWEVPPTGKPSLLRLGSAAERPAKPANSIGYTPSATAVQ